ncbi:MAG: hypothetical protein WCA93_00195 [Acidimicrobiia bacterium]
MRKRLELIVAAIATFALLAACSSSANPSTTTGVTTAPTTTTTEPGTTTSSADTTTTTTAPTTTTPTPDQTSTLLLYPFSELGPNWTETFYPYGDTEDTMSTSPGGDNGSVDWGPDYGTQTPDGTWWFLDGANLRIAHFAADGTYLDQIPMPTDLLSQGIYFQYQLPQALDDGSIWMSGYGRPLVRIADGTVSGSTIADSIPWTTTDGTYLYGFSLDDGAMARLDPNNPPIETVDWFTTRSGTRYRITVQGDEVLVELPDGPVPLTRTLQMRFSEDPNVVAHAGLEVDTGVDGSINIILYGAPESDETMGVGAFVTITADGVVGESEPIRDPFSPSDPGSPAHLGVTPKTSTPWLMMIDEDGVRVYTKGG